MHMFVIPQVGKVIQQAARWPQLITTIVVFVVLLAFAYISYQNARQTLNFQRAQVIDQRLTAIEDVITQRMDENGNMSRAGTALFDGSEAVTETEWAAFFARFNVGERYEGITSIGYAPVVKNGEEAEFLQILKDQGEVNANITPLGTRSEYTPVMFIQAFNGAAGVVGYDMFSSPERKIAMDRARDTGRVTVTDSLSLVSSNQLGAVLYAPVYVRGMPLNSIAERREAIKGYAFTGVKIDQLLGSVLPEEDRENLGMVVSEVRPNNLPKQTYSTVNKGDAKKLQHVKSSEIEIYGKRWQVTLYAGNAIVSDTERERPSTILAGGIAISIIASIAVFLLIQYRTRSFALAEEHKLQQAKDELLSLASHQLRTPATGVKQYVGMVLEGFAGKISKQQIELLDQAYKSNERQLQIINEFLYVAKLGSGSLTTSVHTFDLVPVIKDVMQEMQSDIKEKNHKVTVALAPKVQISADEHSLRMIIENLLSNAVKYTKPGGKIHIELTKNRSEVQFKVKDSGIGIAKNDLNLLFRQFSRIPNELSGEVSGSGIGLYLAQQLAERNGGHISVVSEVNEGSVFTLHLPLKSVRKITKDSN